MKYLSNPQIPEQVSQVHAGTAAVPVSQEAGDISEKGSISSNISLVSNSIGKFAKSDIWRANVFILLEDIYFHIKVIFYLLSACVYYLLRPGTNKSSKDIL